MIQPEQPHLPEPYEYLDLNHAASMTLRIDRFELGTGLIHPTAITPRQIRIYMQQQGLSEPPAPGVPISIWVPVLRVYGVRLDEPSPLTYWDASSKRLQAQLFPLLRRFEGSHVVVRLTANGYKPTKVYSVEQG